MSTPVTAVSAAEQQHLLLLFVPLKKGTVARAAEAAKVLQTPPGTPPDIRAATGVHFFMIYPLADGTAPVPALPVTSFKTMPGKDLLVVMSIYDAEFAPYIGAFVADKTIAAGLNLILELSDESGIVPDTDPTSANYILAHGKVQKNADAFNCFLMRYNFGDPTMAAGSHTNTDKHAKPGTPPKYTFGTNFPGLTVGKVLANYANAKTLWPFPLGPIKFEPTSKPTCTK
jgi:hypothetical protein